MKYLRNSKGITLVELVASVALVSMVAVLIMTTLGIGFKHSIAESNNTSIQQEANLIILKLLNEHRKGDCYFLKTESGEIKIAPATCIGTTQPTTNLFKSVSDSRFNVTMTSPNKMINPTKEDYTLIAEVTLEKAKYKINTKLTRYKTND
jgi:type II secretory pathway pseudopilin PulG